MTWPSKTAVVSIEIITASDQKESQEMSIMSEVCAMKIAMVSSWHVHAKGYAKQIQNDPRTEIVAVWDERPEQGKEWAAELGCRFEADYDVLLSSPDVEAVAVCAPTNMHPEMLIKAAKAKKAIFTEKVLTLTMKDALEVKKAIEENNVLFTISFPHKCIPALIRAKQMVDCGELGKITYARVRNVHGGSIQDWLPPHFYDKEQCGGGAMIDLGAHPMYTLEWILGKAKTVQSAFTNATERPVEDNAVSLLEFEGGAIGVSETGFVSVYNPYTLEISGTKGCALVRGDELSFATEATEGRWGKCEDLPTAPVQPIISWIDSFCEEKPSVFGIEEAVSLSALMEAAYTSFREKRKVCVK